MNGLGGKLPGDWFVGRVETTTTHLPVIGQTLVGTYTMADASANIDLSYDTLDVEQFSVRCGIDDAWDYLPDTRARQMEWAIQDATLALGERVERYVYATAPGTRICIHHPETIIDENRWKSAVIVRRDAHRQPERYRSCRVPGSGGRQLYRSPWPCAFCHRRTAVDYVRACDDCYASYASGWSSVAHGEGWYYLMRCGLTPSGLPLGRRHLGLSAAPPLFGGLMLQMATNGSLQ